MRHNVQRGVRYFKFFRIELGGGQRLHQEVFYLAYHLHWPWSELMEMEIAVRRNYVRMLAQRIEAENEAAENFRMQLR